jgi:hypothetical protein
MELQVWLDHKQISPNSVNCALYNVRVTDYYVHFSGCAHFLLIQCFQDENHLHAPRPSLIRFLSRAPCRHCWESLSSHFSFIMYSLLLTLCNSNQAITSLYFPVMSSEFPAPHKETDYCSPSLAERLLLTERTFLAIFWNQRVLELKMSRCVSLASCSVPGINILSPCGLFIIGAIHVCLKANGTEQWRHWSLCLHFSPVTPHWLYELAFTNVYCAGLVLWRS